MTMTFTHLTEPDWQPMIALAVRLGVDPLLPDASCAVVLHIVGPNEQADRRYDVIALVMAVLDRLDAAERKTHKPIKSY